MAGNIVTVTYIRGNQYIENWYKPAPKNYNKEDIELVKNGGVPKSRLAHGLVGQLWVHGLCYETLERMDGFVHMDGDKRYPNSNMYWMNHHGSYVIKPWLGRQQNLTKSNILCHPAARPSDLVGCIGVGFLGGGIMSLGIESLDGIFRQIGGHPGNTVSKPVFTLAVEGQMKALGACTRMPGG